MTERNVRQAMRFISAIWEKKSFTKAAEALGVTQPALTQAVKKTEEALGVPLFARTKKPLELSEAGRLYLAKAEAIARLEEELRREIADLSELKSGTLTVGGTHYLNAFVLPPVVAAFRRKWPGVALKLVDAGADELLQMLRDGRIDLTFSCEAAMEADCRRTFVFEDRLLLAVPQALGIPDEASAAALTAADVAAGRHRSASCPAVSLSLFAATPFVLLTEGNNLYRRSMAMFEKAGVVPDVVFQAGQLVTAARLAQAGLGAALVSDRLVTGTEASLAYFRLEDELAVRDFDAVSLASRYESKSQSAFASLAEELC